MAIIPLLINEESFKSDNQYQILIQISIILKIYSKKIDQLNKSIQFQLESNDEENEENDDDIQHQSLLQTINAIGFNGGLKFSNFFQAVKDNSIPKFIMYFFNISSIENVNIVEKSNMNDNQLSIEEINNIQSVINFLSQKEEKFEFLIFDFCELEEI